MKKKNVIITTVALAAFGIGGYAIADSNQWAGSPNLQHTRQIVDTLGDRLKIADDKADTLQSQLNKSQANVAEYQNQLNDLKNQLADKDNQIAAKQQEIQEKINETQQAINEGNNKVAAKQAEVDRANQKASDLQNKYNDLQQKDATKDEQLNVALQDAKTTESHAQSVLESTK